MSRSNRKALFTGKFTEVWEYEKDWVAPFTRRKRRKHKGKLHIVRQGNVRAKYVRFVRMCDLNIWMRGAPDFLTLTYADNVEDLDVAQRDFDVFMKRMKRLRDIEYIAVVEFQKRGAVHFHVLLWGLSPYDVQSERGTRCIARIWGHGFIDLFVTDGSRKLASYFGKYLSKALSDIRLYNRRGYRASRGIVRPSFFRGPVQMSCFDEMFPTGDNLLAETTTYETRYRGRCVYKKYLVN